MDLPQGHGRRPEVLSWKNAWISLSLSLSLLLILSVSISVSTPNPRFKAYWNICVRIRGGRPTPRRGNPNVYGGVLCLVERRGETGGPRPRP